MNATFGVSRVQLFADAGVGTGFEHDEITVVIKHSLTCNHGRAAIRHVTFKPSANNQTQ
jgi:hypothetical protein